MNWQDVDITSTGATLSMWPPVLYYIVSTVVGVLLYIGKLFVHRYANFTVFILYAFFVTLFSGIQMCLFRFGDEFAKDILHINLGVDEYDSIFFGTFLFFLLYGIAIPTEFK